MDRRRRRIPALLIATFTCLASLQAAAMQPGDLSYPPRDSDVRFVDRSRGERNQAIPIDTLDAQRSAESHVVIRPGKQPRLHSQPAGSTAASPAPRNDLQRSGRPLLWQVDKAGIPSSYIYGTIHIDDQRVMDLPDAVATRLRTANQLILELPLGQHGSNDILRNMIFTDGRTLQQVIGPDLFRELRGHLQRLDALPDELLAVLKPWAAMVILMRPENPTGTFLDKRLGEIARRDRIPVLGLETVDEQLAAFDAITLEDQTSLLRTTLGELPDKYSAHQMLVNAWLSGDLDQIVMVSQSMLPADRRLAGLFINNLITVRNRRMFDRALPFIEQGNSFVAVGALHLPGDDGLLQRLRVAGFTLTQLGFGH